MSDVTIKCIKRGLFHVERDQDCAAGYRLEIATNREQARQVATSLMQEERRAQAIENVRLKFG